MNKMTDIMLGGAVADALGVPVEFKNRNELLTNPVISMREYGTHKVPAGTWSDDTSMALGILDSLTKGPYNLKLIADNFVKWCKYGEFAIDKQVFDIGVTTAESMIRYYLKGNPLLSGDISEYSCGNGSLMRCGPIALHLALQKTPTDEAITIIHEVSAITHAHMRCKIACGLYYFVVNEIVNDKCNSDLKTLIESALKKGAAYYSEKYYMYSTDLLHFSKLFILDSFSKMPSEKIKSSGYVIDTLEASIYCLINENDYKSTVLKAVNLGGDTDTIGMITGSISGLYYGSKSIPAEWVDVLRDSDYIEKMCDTYWKNNHK